MQTQSRPLLEAASRGDEAEVERLLLEHGADIEAKDNHGWTPLHWAAVYDFPEGARLLLEAGADVNARQITGAHSRDK